MTLSCHTGKVMIPHGSNEAVNRLLDRSQPEVYVMLVKRGKVMQNVCLPTKEVFRETRLDKL